MDATQTTRQTRQTRQTRYLIDNHRGLEGPAWDAEYATIEEASAALREATGCAYAGEEAPDSYQDAGDGWLLAGLTAVYATWDEAQDERDSRWEYAPKIVRQIRVVTWVCDGHDEAVGRTVYCDGSCRNSKEIG